MAPHKPDPTPQETFLAPLIRIVRKSPTIEGLVFWGGGVDTQKVLPFGSRLMCA